MRDKPLVSIVIPTYQRPQFLYRAINSCLNQTYGNVEVIVVDDNNPDTEARKETEALMNTFSNVSNLHYIRHEKNKNGSAARNTGWRAAEGEYITFLDDDDEISPQKIEKQIDCLESLPEDYGACYTAYIVKMPNGAEQHSVTCDHGDVSMKALMRTLYLGSGSNLLLRKKVVDEVNGYDESFRRNQDIEFMARVTEKYKFAYVSDVLLTIYLQPSKNRWDFSFIDGITLFYLDKFNGRIASLSEYDRRRVISVITLDRARVALYYKEFGKAYRMLKDNNVPFKYVVKYMGFIMKRYLTKQSYGFYIE